VCRSIRRRGEPPVSRRQFIPIERTSCHLGGNRAWFVCSSIPCSRRVAILYEARGYFLCRHCLRLAYPSQRETAEYRAGRRADQIRRRLGWQIGILNRRGGRPRGMHWRRYRELTAQHDACVMAALAAEARLLDEAIQRAAIWRSSDLELPPLW
jgi:hypothetical protein